MRADNAKSNIINPFLLFYINFIYSPPCCLASTSSSISRYRPSIASGIRSRTLQISPAVANVGSLLPLVKSLIRVVLNPTPSASSFCVMPFALNPCLITSASVSFSILQCSASYCSTNAVMMESSTFSGAEGSIVSVICISSSSTRLEAYLYCSSLVFIQYVFIPLLHERIIVRRRSHESDIYTFSIETYRGCYLVFTSLDIEDIESICLFGIVEVLQYLGKTPICPETKDVTPLLKGHPHMFIDRLLIEIPYLLYQDNPHVIELSVVWHKDTVLFLHCKINQQKNTDKKNFVFREVADFPTTSLRILTHFPS